MKHFTLMISAVAFAFAANAQFSDSGFESGPGAGTWEEFSVNFGTPLCDAASCGTCGGPCVPNNGTWYAWFGGAGGVTESGYVQQSVFIPSGNTAQLRFFLKMPTGDNTITGDKVEITIDGNVVYSANASQMADFAEYTQVSVDIPSYANGAVHVIKAEGIQSTATVYNALLDDWSLVVNGNTVNVGEFMNREINLAVYPNPTTDVINVQFDERTTGAGLITIFSLTGELILSKTINEVSSKIFSFDATTLAKGMYIVNVQADGISHTERIVVQ